MNPGRQALQPYGKSKNGYWVYFLWLLFNHSAKKYKDMYVAEFSTGLYTGSVDKRVWDHCY